MLQKVLVPWALQVSHPDQAHVWVSLRPARGEDQCLGTVVVGTYPGAKDARHAVRIGTGGSFPGHNPLPSTPL